MLCLGLMFSPNGKVVKTQAILADQPNKAITQSHKIQNLFKTLWVHLVVNIFFFLQIDN